MNKQEEVKFTQSGFLKIDGKKRVSVRFERGSDIAEGMLPPGKITKNHGFSDKEVAGLEIYLEMNCDEIYKKAKEIGKFTNEIYRKGIRSDNALRRAAGKNV